MLDHMTFRVTDIAKAKAFYSAALAPLGYSVCFEGNYGANILGLAYPDADKRLFELQQSLARVETALPGSLDVSVFMSQLQRDAAATGVRLTNIKPSVLVDRAGYREMPIEVSFEGNYHTMLAFLKKLEDGERFSLPTGFLIQRKQDKLTTRLNLQIFCYGVTPRPAPGVAPQAPPAR